MLMGSGLIRLTDLHRLRHPFFVGFVATIANDLVFFTADVLDLVERDYILGVGLPLILVVDDGTSVKIIVHDHATAGLLVLLQRLSGQKVLQEGHL